MLLKKSLVVNFFLISLLLGGISAPRNLSCEQIPCDISASVALLINAETGKVLFSRNAEEPLYPASTTKVATALYALHKKSSLLNEMVTVSHDCVSAVPINVRRSSGKHPSYRLEFGGTLMGLKLEEQVDFKTLLYGLLLPSGNDAANVIAETVSGSVSQFMIELNNFLKEIGCHNTYFKNPHGLPDVEHVTTAKDLARMGQMAMKNPFFKQIVSSSKYIKAETNKQPEVILSQHNAIVKPASKYYYPHATGIKTGYTIQAGHTLVASAEKGDRSLIAVVCHKESSEMRFRNTIQLFEAAFKEPKKTRTLFSGIHDSFSKKVEGAKEILKAALAEDVKVSFYPSEEPKYYSQIRWKSHDLPIEAGSFVGEVLVFDDRDVLQETSSLFAVKKLEPTFSYQVQKITKQGRDFLQKHRSYLGYFTALALLSGAILRVTRKRKRA
jgi:D-alanyl-D-alanine carboxypeptidase (penicillin-binding protein 5/6)